MCWASGDEPNKNTHSELTEVGDKRRIDMKFSFHIDDIELVSEVWYEILHNRAYEKLDDRIRHKEVRGEEYSTIDTLDMRYMEKVFKKHPKMKRLMPSIIKESLILYGYNESSSTGFI